MKRKLITTTLTFAIAAVVGLAFLAFMTGEAAGYDTFTTDGTDNCAQCHTDFGGFGAAGHDLHVDAMTLDCDLCHPSGGGSTPVSTSSSGPITGGNGVGCIGCHLAPGLREHHRNAAAATCGGCHASPEMPAPESTLPPYYGTADVNGVNDPCNLTAQNLVNENWDGNFIGLDNDGDLLYDGNDPDCQAAPGGAIYVPATGVLTIGEVQLNPSKAVSAELTLLNQPGILFGLTDFAGVMASAFPDATYNAPTGVLTIPVLTVQGLTGSWTITLTKQAGGFTFRLTSKKRN